MFVRLYIRKDVVIFFCVVDDVAIKGGKVDAISQQTCITSPNDNNWVK